MDVYPVTDLLKKINEMKTKTKLQDIKVGDLVLSKSDKTGNTTYKKVTQLFHNKNKPILNLTIINQDGIKTQFGATAEHPFLVKNQGWTDASNLKTNDELVSANGKSIKVVSIELDDKRQDTYNFEVADYHTYFVGDDGVWVHNVCFGNFKNHVSRHALSGKSAQQYYNSALKNVKDGF